MMFPLLLLGVVIWLAYKWWTSIYSQWDRRGVQNVPSSSPLGSDASLTLMTKYQGYTLNEMYKKFSTPYFGLYMVRSPFLVIKNPEIISIILTKEFSHFRNRQFLKIHKSDFIFQHLFNLEDDKWKTTKGKLQSTFSTSKLRSMFPLFIKCTENFQSVLLQKEGETINMKPTLKRFTTDVICQTLFGLEANTNCESEVTKIGQKATDLNLLILLKVAIKLAFPEIAKNIPLKVFPTDVEKFFLKLVTDIVEYREKNDVKVNDFLDSLIQMKKRGMTGEEKKFENGNINWQSQDITLEVMAAQCFFLFVAGLENASSMQTYCLYELALNPDLQKTLQSEIDNCLKKHGELTYEAIKEMEFLNMAISETLRKYPVLPFTSRICTTPLTFPDGFQVEKGDQMIIPTWSLQHDPQYFPDPEKFDPERFSEQNKDSIVPYTYLPFGEGPRMCLGMRFSQLQMKVGIVSILSKYNVEPTKDTQIPIPLKGRAFSTLPDVAVNLRLVSRS
ncbi:cytochrome P450 6a2 isoform X2 [Halyomorpha halys]|nr:cytochrome P450 6a2-like isoform X2 [Halyomorpha halys]